MAPLFSDIRGSFAVIFGVQSQFAFLIALCMQTRLLIDAIILDEISYAFLFCTYKMFEGMGTFFLQGW